MILHHIRSSGVLIRQIWQQMAEMELTIGGYGPEKSAHGKGLAVLRDTIQQETDGRIEVRVVWNIMDLGRPNTDLFEMVESGEMFLCYFSTSYQGGQVPELNIIESPYLFRDLDHAHRNLDGALGAQLQEAVRSRTGFELLGFWDNGFRHMTNRHHAIHTPDDLAGMTVRLQPNEIHEELIRAWGGEPIGVDLKPGVQMIINLEVDAQENPLANSVAYGVDRVHRYWTMTGHLYGSRGLFANKATYQRLDVGLRDVVDSAVVTAVAQQRTAAESLERQLRTRLEASGHEFVDPTDEQRGLFERMARPAIEMAQENVPQDLFEMVVA